MMVRPRSTRRSRLHLSFAACAAVVLPVSGAMAAPASVLDDVARFVVVVPPPCAADALPVQSFLDSLRVELAGRGLHCCTLADAAGGAATRGSVVVTIGVDACVPDPELVRVTAQSLPGARAEREVALADVVPATRPRTLALAVAELLRSLEPSDVEPPRSPAVAPTETAVAASPAVSPAKTRFVTVEAETRIFPNFPTRETVMWGGRARLGAGRRSFHAAFDFGAGFASASSALGDVLLRSATLGFAVGPRMTTSELVVDIGLRAELGWAWIHGAARVADIRAGAGSDLVSTLGLRISVAAPTSRSVRGNLGIEAGGVLRGMRGEVGDQTVVGMTGYYLLAALGVSDAW